MGEQFKHLNIQAAEFILEKTFARRISYTNQQYGNIFLQYYLFQPMKDHKGTKIQPVRVTQRNGQHTVYEYKLTLHQLYSLKFPEYLNPDNQELPHEWVWRLHYEETV